jgi:hypothetical protein
MPWSPESPLAALMPSQVWMKLTSRQQRSLFQTMVRICQDLVAATTARQKPEVPYE